MNAMVATGAPPALPQGILRLVRFDLWRYRWLALLIVALESARAVFIEWAMHVLPPVIGERFGGNFGTHEVALLDVVLTLSTVLATAVLVQADLPSDDRAFWRTRPIAPVGLALAKLATFALLFIVGPAAINAGRLLAYGAPLEAVGAATLQLAVGAGHVVIPAWSLALLARTLPRFVIGGVVTVFGTLLTVSAGLYWAAMWLGRAENATAIAWTSFVLDWQRVGPHGWWFATGVTVGAAAILTWHYQHRRTGRSAAAVSALLVVSWLQSAPVAPSASPALAHLVSQHLDVSGLTLPSAGSLTSRPAKPYPVTLGVRLALPDLPGGVSAAVALHRPTLRGATTVTAGDGWQCCFGKGEAEAVAALARPPRPDDAPRVRRQGPAIAAKDVEALRDRAVTFEADAEVHLRRHRWIGTLPLRPGAAFRGDDEMLHVLAYEPTLGPTYVALVRYTEFPSLAPAESPWTLFAGNRATAPSALSNWGPSGTMAALTNRAIRWGSGRTWVGRFHVVVEGGAQLGPEPQIYIVESRPLGAVRLPLRKAGVQVSTAREGAPAR